MKHFISRITVIALAIALPGLDISAQQMEFKVDGRISYPMRGKKVLITDGNTVIDSIAVNSDSTFNKKITPPSPRKYYIEYASGEKVPFWGENEDVSVELYGRNPEYGKFKRREFIKIQSAGESNRLVNLINYGEFLKRDIKLETIKDQLKYKKEEAAKEILAAEKEKGLHRINFYYELLSENYKHVNSAVILLDILPEGRGHNELLSYLKTNRAQYPPFVEWIKKKERSNSSLIGRKMLPFNAVDMDGKKIRVLPEMFESKVTIVDFWASWCKPCRKAIPFLKDIYSRYKERGLQMFSVSMDANPTAWKKAVSEEKPEWLQLLSDEEIDFWKEKYQIMGIPYIMIIDKNGIVLSEHTSLKDIESILQKAGI